MSTLVLRRRRDPLADFDAIFRTALPPVTWAAGFTPAAEINRDGDDVVVRLELPGLDAERDITVEVDHGHLVVRGERRDERSDEATGRFLREVRYGAFRRSFSLPEHVTGDDLTASYDAGVLTVRIAGAHAGTTPRRIPVNGTGSGPADATVEPTESAQDEQAA